MKIYSQVKLYTVFSPSIVHELIRRKKSEKMEYKRKYICCGECIQNKDGPFKLFKKWKSHVYNKHFKKCQTCEVKFKTRKETLFHFYKKHLWKTYLCPICKSEEKTKKELKKHRCEKCVACSFFFSACICECGPAQIVEEHEAWRYDENDDEGLSDPFPFTLYGM